MIKRIFGLAAILTLAFFIVGRLTSPAEAVLCSLTPEAPYKTASSPSIFYITEDCKKYYIATQEAYFSFFTTWADVRTVTRAELQNIPTTLEHPFAKRKSSPPPATHPIGGVTADVVVRPPTTNLDTAETRDRERIKHLRQIQTALELYFVDHRFYPVQTGTLGQGDFGCLGQNGFAPAEACGNLPYMLAVPSDPGQFSYVYRPLASGADYRIAARLEGATWCAKDLILTSSGIHTADGSKIFKPCAPEFRPPRDVEL